MSVRAIRRTVLATVAVACLAPAAHADKAPAADAAVRVDALFASWTAETPGCAVGVSKDDKEMLARAYGSADLEHGVANTPETVFESGSISKQFTASAILLLAQAGKLELDDPVQKYIPELPDYGAQTLPPALRPTEPNIRAGSTPARLANARMTGAKVGSSVSAAGWPLLTGDLRASGAGRALPTPGGPGREGS